MNDILCSPVSGNERGTVWSLMGRVGEDSLYGTVWQACLKKDCTYVLKSQKYSKDAYRQITKETIKKEVDMQNKIAKEGLALKIKDWWLCDKGGVIIMKSLKQTVRNLLLEYNNDIVRHMIIGTCIGLLHRLHLSGYYHGDSHLNNIMVTYDQDDYDDAIEEDREEDKYKTVGYKFYFIDLGDAGSLSGDDTLKHAQIQGDYIKVATSLHVLVDEGVESIKSLEELVGKI